MSDIKVGDKGWSVDFEPATVVRLEDRRVWYKTKNEDATWCSERSWINRILNKPLEVECDCDTRYPTLQMGGKPRHGSTCPLSGKVETAPEYTGGSVDYYKVGVKNPTTASEPYTAECNDIIEALGMNYAEGNAFKALWRRAAHRTLGKKKAGAKDDGLYDAEKVAFFGQRLVEQSKAEK